MYYVRGRAGRAEVFGWWAKVGHAAVQQGKAGRQGSPKKKVSDMMLEIF